MNPAPEASNACGPDIAVLGPGAVGRALAHNLAAAGCRVRLVVGRTLESAQALARHLPFARATDRLEDLPGEAHVVFCTVTDDALPLVAERLARAGADWKGRVVAHTSGSRTSGVLAPLAGLGADVMSFYPVQTFPPTGAPPSFAGILVGLEGTARAVEVARTLAERLGGLVLELQPESKPLFHLGGVAASNFLVALLSCVHETLRAAGADPDSIEAAVVPLVEATWENVRRLGPEAALTGPVVRGDRGTIASHLEAINRQIPHLAPFYAAMTAETVRVAVRSGRLTAGRAETLLDDLQRWIAEWSSGRTSPR